VELHTTGLSRRLADDERHFIDPAVRLAEVFVGIVSAASVVIFIVARQSHRRRGRLRVAGGR
jgi:hypothetical protein